MLPLNFRHVLNGKSLGQSYCLKLLSKGVELTGRTDKIFNFYVDILDVSSQNNRQYAKTCSVLMKFRGDPTARNLVLV